MLAGILRLFRFVDTRGSELEAKVETRRLMSPETSIAYKATLVPELIREHRELLRVFQTLMAAHEAKLHDESILRMKTFATLLRAHLLKENLHLYVYLKHALQHDSELTELMNAMRAEMGAIGKVLNQFVTKYTTSPWDSETREQLGTELTGIASVLQKRIAQEESTLYTMYLPPSSYN